MKIFQGRSPLNTCALRPTGWVLCITMMMIGLMRCFWPSHVGLFVYAHHHWAFGVLRDIAGGQEQGGMFITPGCLGIAGLLYLVLDNPRQQS